MLLVGLPIGLAAMGYTAAGLRMHSARRAWARSFGPLESILAQFPTTEPDPRVERLHERTRAFGIAMRSVQPSTPFEADFRRLRALVSGQASRMDDTLDPLPPDLAAFLTGHEAVIAAAESYLLEARDIRWAVDLSRGYDAQVPVLLGGRRLHDVLLARALHAAQRGDAAGAERAVEAAWHLEHAYHSRPELVPNLLALELVVARNAVLRRLRDLPAVWAERTGPPDAAALHRACRSEAYWLSRLGDGRTGIADLGDPILDPDRVDLQRWPPALVRVATAPYVQAGIADSLDAYRVFLERTAAADPCTLDHDALARDVSAAKSRWNIVARTALSSESLSRSWARLTHALLDAELTRVVLKARQKALAPSARRLVPSRVCARLSWVVETATNGQVTITADPADPLRRPAGRPWRFTF